MGIGQGEARGGRAETDRHDQRTKRQRRPRLYYARPALAKSGKTEEALAAFDRALALDPYNVQALYGRGLIYQADKQHEQAIADFTAANGLTPQQVEPLLARQPAISP